MKAKGILRLTILGAALFAVPLLVRAQQPDVDRQVQEAKALYRDGSFAEAIVKLQDAVSRLQLLRDIEAKKMQLAEAYLHMSLSYFALDNRAAAKETLKGLLRVDKERRLDPQIYAPPVIALFEEARLEVLLEPVTADSTTGVRPSPSVAPKKGGSKAPLIVLGAAAAGGGVALAAKGGSAAATTTPSVAATPAPGANNIALVTADPPAGSTISVSSRQAVTFVFSINASERAHLNISLDRSDFFGPNCFAFTQSPSIDPGTSLPLTLFLDISNLARQCTTLPTREMRLFTELVRFGQQNTPANHLATAMFSVNYSVAR